MTLNPKSLETLELLLSRRSGKARRMKEPGPDADALRKILLAGQRVSDHGKLTPWRFIVFEGDNSGVVALQDTDGDGVADVIEHFGDFEGTGIGIKNGYLYYGTRGAILRMKLESGQMVPADAPEILVHLDAKRWHGEKPFTFDGEGNIYVNMGGPANACQQQPVTPGSPGHDPDP